MGTQIVPVNTRRPSPPEININTKCDFQCWDGMCQPWEARCNGANDCLKGEDEMKCHNSNPQLWADTAAWGDRTVLRQSNRLPDVLWVNTSVTTETVCLLPRDAITSTTAV